MEDVAKRDFREISLVVAGNCNGNSWSQEYLGTLIFKQMEGVWTPFLRDILGDPPKHLELTFLAKRPGEYMFEAPGWCKNHGLRIRLNSSKQEYRFSTGLHPYDSGSSGSLAFGGAEMVESFDRIYQPSEI
jgi:hypothetical protein